MNKLEKIYLHTGSNLGRKEEHLKQARQQIEKSIGPILAQSGLFETEAWGHTDQPSFVNQALEVMTLLSPEELMNQILDIEMEMGRIRNQKWAPRLIDIDVIFFGDKVIKTENLTVPHPFMHKRNFVLVPLLEIAGDFIHPQLKMSVKTLFEHSEDPLNVKAYSIQ